jgi:hypothetical protein
MARTSDDASFSLKCKKTDGQKCILTFTLDKSGAGRMTLASSGTKEVLEDKKLIPGKYVVTVEEGLTFSLTVSEVSEKYAMPGFIWWVEENECRLLREFFERQNGVAKSFAWKECQVSSDSGSS